MSTEPKSGLVSITTKANPGLMKSDGQRLAEKLDRLEREGRAVGAKEDYCAPLAPDTCRTTLEKSAWVNGYMDGYAGAARREVAHGR
jgi:hypothetical protein